MTTITKERLLTIKQWRETYGPGSNVVLPAEEAEELARIALAALEVEPVAVNDDMAYAFHHALSDSSLGADEVEEIKAGLRAAFANVTIQPEPVVPDDGREKFEALVRIHAGDKDHETLLLRANEGMNYQDPNVDLAWIFWKSSREHI
ncbi:hypothetical protein OW596_004513 [Escherichia coli]|nr:hypothetical protein [Escherichia coli]EFH5619749.1 hypothetical protein [Escherichia coli]EFM0482732.1 hypothetical protein [Escherichia coli]EFM0659816.1 hypothetical protein [Escherichia coli]EFN5100736.1 hypothetical protein [Escherichia coli]